MSVQEDLKAIEAGLERRDAEIARLRAEVERLKAEDDVHWKTRRALLAYVSARDRVIESAFKALDSIETQLDGTNDRLGIMATVDGYYEWHKDEHYLNSRELSTEARRLRAELEGK